MERYLLDLHLAMMFMRVDFIYLSIFLCIYL